MHNSAVLFGLWPPFYGYKFWKIVDLTQKALLIQKLPVVHSCLHYDLCRYKLPWAKVWRIPCWLFSDILVKQCLLPLASEVWSKVMFSQVFPWTHFPWTHPSWTPRTHLCWTHTTTSRTSTWTHTPLGTSPRSTSGQYASYWNAFLSFLLLTTVTYLIFDNMS